MKKLMFIGLYAEVALLLMAGAGCKKSDSNSSMSSSSSGNSSSVSIQNMAFSPSTITIAINTTVIWTNNDNVAHTVTSDTGAFNSGTISNGGGYYGGGGGSFSFKFTTAGTYPYHCSIHTYMKGTVVVH